MRTRRGTPVQAPVEGVEGALGPEGTQVSHRLLWRAGTKGDHKRRQQRRLPIVRGLGVPCSRRGRPAGARAAAARGRDCGRCRPPVHGGPPTAPPLPPRRGGTRASALRGGRPLVIADDQSPDPVAPIGYGEARRGSVGVGDSRQPPSHPVYQRGPTGGGCPVRHRQVQHPCRVGGTQEAGKVGSGRPAGEGGEGSLPSLTGGRTKPVEQQQHVVLEQKPRCRGGARAAMEGRPAVCLGPCGPPPRAWRWGGGRREGGMGREGAGSRPRTAPRRA